MTGSALWRDDELAATNWASDPFVPSSAWGVKFGEEPSKDAYGVE